MARTLPLAHLPQDATESYFASVALESIPERWAPTNTCPTTPAPLQSALLANQTHFALVGEIQQALPTDFMHADCFVEGLWQHSVLEVFIGSHDSLQYLEVNLGPRRSWWACAFDTYRQRSTHVLTPVASTIGCRDSGTFWRAWLVLPWAALPNSHSEANTLTANTCGIIYDRERVRYFSYTTPTTPTPDFHHPSLRSTVSFC